MIAVVIPTLDHGFTPPSYEGISVFVVYDGPPQNAKNTHLLGHQKGFAHACNVGLAYAQHQGFRHVLILNDDAHLTQKDLHIMYKQAQDEVSVIGPVIIDDQGIQSAGIRYSSWGRVFLNKDVTCTSIQALSGACLLMPSWLRFDEGYPHGFEDIELCSRVQQMNIAIRLARDARCFHLGGKSIAHHSRLWFQHSIYGQLRFFKKRRYLPLVVAMGFLQARNRVESIKGVYGGAMLWWHQRSSRAT